MTLNGLLLVDKPTDLTSHDVVARLRRILGQKRIGHTGTLDPIATGLMIMVLGEATKLSDYLVSEDKAYEVEIRLGVTTDTLDRTGQILERRPVAVSEDEARAAVHELQGEFHWPVPVYSAVKVKGRPLHEMARAAEPVEPPVKTMKFWDARMTRFAGDSLTVELSCSKGSFVRTWVQKLGERLGTGAVVEELRRSRVGDWSLAESVTLEALEKGQDTGFVAMADALKGYRTVFADDKETRLIGHGQIARSLASRLIPEQKQAFASGQAAFIRVLSVTGELLALIAAEPGQGLKIRRVFQSL